MATLPRYTTIPLPPYRFIPGKSPHPTRDPEGHSCAESLPSPAVFDAGMWRDCSAYLYGVDLFNHGYWWEAHESLEAVWVAAGRHSETGLFIQGLIQISAAHLKRHQGYRDAAMRLAGDGLDKAGHVPGKYYLGIDVPRFCKNVQAWLEQEEPVPVVIELEFDRSTSAG